MPPLNQGSLVQRILQEARQRKEDAAELAELFALCLPCFTIDERQLNIWLRRYDQGVIAEAIERTAAWYDDKSEMAEKAIREKKPVPAAVRRAIEAGLPFKSNDDVIRYATKVMINKTNGVNPGRTEPTETIEFNVENEEMI